MSDRGSPRLYKDIGNIGIAVKDRLAVPYEYVDARARVRAFQGADEGRREKRVSDPRHGNQKDTLHELIRFNAAVVRSCLR